MKVFIIADTHFYHENIIRYCNRPFDDTTEMNRTMVENWNKVVGKDDIVIHLGDFGFGAKEQLTEICNQLNGKKILIKGNHDMRKGNGFWLDCGFEAVFKQKQIQLSNVLQDIAVFPLIANDSGIEFITSLLDKGYNDLILSHNPVKINDNELNIHGHIHNAPLDLNEYKQENHICVSTELLDYKPIELLKLLK